MGLKKKNLFLGVSKRKIRFRKPNVLLVSESQKYDISDSVYEHFDFSAVGGSIWSRAAEPLSGTNRRWRGRCVD